MGDTLQRGEENIGEYRGEYEWEKATKESSVNDSDASSTSTFGDNTSLGGGGTDRTKGAAEDGRGCRHATRSCRICGGCKVRERSKGGWERQAGDEDSAVNLKENYHGRWRRHQRGTVPTHLRQ